MKIFFGTICALALGAVFGNAKPSVIVKRGFEDRRSIELSWDKSENVEKYVLRRGIEKGKLFSERTVYENFVKGSFLNAESPYFFSVQAVNSNGKSPLSFAETK